MKAWRNVLFVSVLVSGLGVIACGQPPAQPPAPPPVAPDAPAAGLRVYVSDETGNSVAVVDPVAGQVIEQLAVGKRPRGLRVLPGGQQLLVALSGSALAPPGTDESKLPPPDRSADGIGVVDLATHKVLGIVKSGNDPESFDVSLDGKIAYVSNEDAGELSVLDLAGGTILKRVKVGEEPEGVTTRPDGLVVYVTSEGDGEVTAVNTTTHEIVGHVKTGARPAALPSPPTAPWHSSLARMDGRRPAGASKALSTSSTPKPTSCWQRSPFQGRRGHRKTSRPRGRWAS